MKITADENIPSVSKCFSSIGEVQTIAGRQMTAEAIRDTDILLVRSVTKVDGELLSESNVRFVGTATIGFEHIDIDFLKDKRIGFASAPGSNANSVAEYVVAGLLNVAQKYEFDLEGKSIGIIGVGNVGSKVEVKCRALGMKVVLNDPPLKRETSDQKYRPIEEIFGCDIITLHTPLTYEGPDKTYHLAGEEFFKFLKDGCIFLNTARGAVTDTAALKEAIKSGKLKATILDVWENEPGIDVELLEMVDIGTPHIAGYSLDGKINGMVMIYKAVCEYFGLKAKYDVSSFLPRPTVAKLKVGAADELVEIVGKVYSINDDYARLMKITERLAGEQGEYFSQLRKEYPVRREFQNTKIKIADSGQPFDYAQDKLIADSKKLEDRLAGIGFKLGEKRK